MTSSGQVRYQLKTPYRDGSTHIVMELLDLIARLAALIPPTRMHLTRNHGVFGVEIEGCARCGGKFKIVASIEEPAVIARILAHLDKTAGEVEQSQFPLGARAMITRGFAVLAERFTPRIAGSGPQEPGCGWTSDPFHETIRAGRVG